MTRAMRRCSPRPTSPSARRSGRGSKNTSSMRLHDQGRGHRRSAVAFEEVRRHQALLHGAFLGRVGEVGTERRGGAAPGHPAKVAKACLWRRAELGLLLLPPRVRLRARAGSSAGVPCIAFLLMHLLPGDPAVIIAGAEAGAEAMERIRHQLGPRPLDPEQLVLWLSHLAQGDFGRSLHAQPERARGAVPSVCR